jgi:hypothetical protein
MRSSTLLFLGVAPVIALGCTATKRQFGPGGGPSSASASTGTGGASTGSSATGTSTGGATSSSGTGGTKTCASNDCSDPACAAAGYSCAPPVPTGWSGPSVLFTGTGMPPGCGSAWQGQPVIGGLDVNAQPASCQTCSCSLPQGDQCGGPPIDIVFAQDPQCINGPVMMVPPAFGACMNAPGFFQTLGVRAGPVQALNGNCAPSGGVPNLPPAAFGTQAAVCAGPSAMGVGCPTGMCVPGAPAGYASSVCIFQQGDVACPPTDYVKKTTVYSSIQDGRTCTPCSCGPSVGGTCAAQIWLYDPNTPCGAPPPYIFPADGTCQPLGGQQIINFILQPAGPPTGGSCPSAGGQPVGSATGAQPFTVCCH